jgi:hypothetical protein
MGNCTKHFPSLEVLSVDEKIINFFEKANDADRLLPVQRDSLLQQLSEIQPDIAQGYAKRITDYIEGIFLLRDIILSTGRPQQCQYLLERFDEIQMERLKKIILHLSSEDPVEKIQELDALTFNITTATAKSSSKALELIDLVKSLDVDLKETSQSFILLARRITLFAHVCTAIDSDKEGCAEVLYDQLSQVHETALDRMIEMGNTLRETINK